MSGSVWTYSDDFLRVIERNATTGHEHDLAHEVLRLRGLLARPPFTVAEGVEWCATHGSAHEVGMFCAVAQRRYEDEYHTLAPLFGPELALCRFVPLYIKEGTE